MNDVWLTYPDNLGRPALLNAAHILQIGANTTATGYGTGADAPSMPHHAQVWAKLGDGSCHWTVGDGDTNDEAWQLASRLARELVGVLSSIENAIVTFDGEHWVVEHL